MEKKELLIRRAKNQEDWKKVEGLYMTAFPEEERRPFSIIQNRTEEGKSDVWMLEDEDFAGLAITMNGDDIVILDFFAIADEKRGCGYGSIALKELQDMYRDYRFILEIERPDIPSENQEDRIRRKAFYLRNGMKALDIPVNLFGVEMELLANDCEVTFEEYKNVYRSYLGELAEENVKQGIEY